MIIFTYTSSCSSNYTLRMDANHMGTQTNRQTDRQTESRSTHRHTRNKNTACTGNRHANNMRSTTKHTQKHTCLWNECVCTHPNTNTKRENLFRPVVRRFGHLRCRLRSVPITKLRSLQHYANKRQVKPLITHQKIKTLAYSAPVFSSFVSMGSSACARSYASRSLFHAISSAFVVCIS